MLRIFIIICFLLLFSNQAHSNERIVELEGKVSDSEKGGNAQRVLLSVNINKTPPLTFIFRRDLENENQAWLSFSGRELRRSVNRSSASFQKAKLFYNEKDDIYRLWAFSRRNLPFFAEFSISEHTLISQSVGRRYRALPIIEELGEESGVPMTSIALGLELSSSAVVSLGEGQLEYINQLLDAVNTIFFNDIGINFFESYRYKIERDIGASYNIYLSVIGLKRMF